MRPISRPTLAIALALGTCVAVWPARGQTKGDRDFGEYISSQCVTCHQASGQYKGIPSIVGWPEESFVEIMNDYRHKKRSNAIMQTIAGGLTNEEVSALAAYFGSLVSRPDSE